MALRLYFNNQAAPATPPAASLAGGTAWYEDTSQAIYRSMDPTKIGANTSTTATESDTGSAWDVLVAAYVSPPFLRQATLPLTDTQQNLSARNNNTGNAQQATLCHWVMAPDGSVRGIVRPVTNGSTIPSPGMGTSGWNARLFDFTFTVYPGDRFVLELGFRGITAAATSWIARYGGTDATDLISGDTVANCSIRSPWVEYIGVSETLWTAGGLAAPFPTPRHTEPIRRTGLR